MESKLEERVLGFILDHEMLKEGDRVTAGISGGADSVCLLFLLKDICTELNVGLYALHVNHNLRGEESDADERFVRDLCEREGIPLRVCSCDVSGRAKREKLTLEEAGRLCRYEALRSEAARLGGARIAVAHHADDQAETVLMNLFRGTGIRGLSGMEPVKGDIIRPLLCVRRGEIIDWLRERQIPWRTDSSNENVTYTRNRIRHGILKTAEEEINAGSVRHISEAAEELGEIEACLEKETRREAARLVKDTGDGCSVDISGLLTLEPLIARRVLRECLEHIGGLKDVERCHIQLLYELARKQSGSRLSMPGGREALRGYDRLFIRRAGAGAEEFQPVFPEIPGSVKTGRYNWRFSLEAAQKSQIIPQKTYTKWFDYDKIKQCLEIRGRKAGDYLEINSEHDRKTLKRYLTDEKIGSPERENLLFLADGSHILWIPGHRISEAYKVTAQTERILIAEIFTGGEDDGEHPGNDSGDGSKCED